MMSFGMFGCDEPKEHSRICYYDNGFLISIGKNGGHNLGPYRDVLEAKEVADKLNCPWRN